MPWLNGIEVNEAQYEAITHNKGPALVIAGPGSGKTLVITQRIKYLIEQHHIRPEQILVITFTKAAAIQMQERFEQIMYTGVNQVTFGTFHAIYFHILKQAYHYQKNNILTQAEKYKYLKEAMQSIRFYSESAQENPFLQNEYMQLLLEEISRVKNLGIKSEQYKPQLLETEMFQQVFKAYQRILWENRKLDFEDMVLQCYQLLKGRQDILNGWRQRFRYILIDEFQDICPMQFAVIRELASPDNNLFIVGDDDQSIYSFRGATPGLMLDFPTQYPDVRKIVLNVNYRCQEDILKASTSLISHNLKRYHKELIPNIQSEKEKENVLFYQYPDENEQCEAILNYATAYVEQGGRYSDFAVLYRTNTGASRLAERCVAFQVPFSMKERVQNIYTRFFVQDILAYIRFALGERKRSLFYQIMNKPVRYIQRAAVQKDTVQKEALLQQYSGKDYICREIEQLWTQLVLLKEMSPFAAINYIRKGIGYDSYLEKIAENKSEERKEWIEQLDEIQKRAAGFATLEEWLQYIDTYSQEIQDIKKPSEDAIQIMTMHAAKGLEWKRVWVPDLNEGNIPYKKATSSEELEEERRMLYVAMTRARERLILSSVVHKGEDRMQNISSNSQERKGVVSRFVKEIRL